MTTPTPQELRDELSTNPDIIELAEDLAKEVFEEQFQGDAFIDRVQDLMQSLQWLAGGMDDDDIDPCEEDVRIECVLTDEVWTRAVSIILMKMQDTRRGGGR
jgi:ribosome assembly protein YihI (activator of Der GTPase)